MSRPSKVLLPCGHCYGSGKKEAPELSATLRVVSHARWQATLAIAKLLGLKQGAVCNRLAALLKLGLLDRRGSGSRHSPYEWRVKL